MTTTHFTLYTRMQFEGLLSDESVLVANNDLDILTLLERGRIIAQEVFPTMIRDSGVALVKLFWQHYPSIVTYDTLDKWFPREDGVRQRSQRRLSRTTYSPRYYTFFLRKRLKQFGITIAARPNVGYELRPLAVPPTRDLKRLEDIALPGILDDDFTLTLCHEGFLQHKRRVLTLLQGMAIVEQRLLPPRCYSLFLLLLENKARGISQKELVMHYYSANVRQATKWLEDAKGDRSAHQELMLPAWNIVSMLRNHLRPFGITVEAIRGYGYALGRIPATKGKERARV